MTSKNSGKTVNSNSCHSQRKDNKKNNNNKLIPTSSDEEQAADNIVLVPLNKRLQAQDKQDLAAKKARTFSEKDMELDLAAPSALPSDISSSTVQTIASLNSAVDPSAAATIITQAPESQVAQPNDTLPNEATQHQGFDIPPGHSLSEWKQGTLDRNDSSHGRVQDPDS